MILNKELGLRIRNYRKQKKLSQEQLAEMCGLHPTYIGQVERGEKNLQLITNRTVPSNFPTASSYPGKNIFYLSGYSEASLILYSYIFCSFTAIWPGQIFQNWLFKQCQFFYMMMP